MREEGGAGFPAAESLLLLTWMAGVKNEGEINTTRATRNTKLRLAGPQCAKQRTKEFCCNSLSFLASSSPLLAFLRTILVYDYFEDR